MSTTILGPVYRITFLTSRLVRLEYQPNGCFEDAPTTMARCRDFPEVAVTQVRGAHGLELDTEHLHIVYDEGEFTGHGLSIAVKGNLSAYTSTWRFGQAFKTLGGTARTLDTANGAIPLEPGLVSRDGFSVLDDSASMELDENGAFRPRSVKETDLYFFGYGHDYAQCLKDFYRLSGATPMLPRYALGNWWSRYHEYTEETYRKLLDDFAAHDVPLSVAVFDMDWHLTDVPYGSGWTGYTWNKDFFPDPARFLREVHDRGLRITLNLHPAGGVQPHEEQYEAFCRAVGRDPEQKLGIDFDAADDAFMKAYYEQLHRPLEDEGVDFWWIDWQQGGVSSVEGLDPMWVLNEGHYRDTQRSGKRSLILSRYAGPGSHRCPVGFSGDTIVTWDSLDFQPYFTATASNIGYPWWSHDIGGHMNGARDDEMATRWLEFGVFSPIVRLHSSKNLFASKEPWTYGPQASAIMQEQLRLRHRLVPYLYTAAERLHTEGEPLIRPMYYGWPEREEAYHVPNQYLFGSEMLVCPITQPMDRVLNAAAVKAWLPEGLWFDLRTGAIYTGDKQLTLYRGLESIPVLVKAGGIVPLAEDLRADRNPAHLTLRVFAGADGDYTLYEDDGVSLDSAAVRTHIHLDWEKGALSLSVDGERSLLPEKRVWNVECIGFENTAVTVDGMAVETHYDASRNALCFTVELDADCGGVTAEFARAELMQDDWFARVEQRLQGVQSLLDEKEAIWKLLKKRGRTAGAMSTLRAMCQTPGLPDFLEEVVWAQE